MRPRLGEGEGVGELEGGVVVVSSGDLEMAAATADGVVPHCWGIKVLMQAVEGQPYRVYVLVARLYFLVPIALLLRQFRRSAHV